MKKLRSRLSNGSEKLRRGQLVGDVVELRRAAVGRAGGRSSGLEELKRGASAGSPDVLKRVWQVKHALWE